MVSQEFGEAHQACANGFKTLETENKAMQSGHESNPAQMQ